MYTRVWFCNKVDGGGYRVLAFYFFKVKKEIMGIFILNRVQRFVNAKFSDIKHWLVNFLIE